MLAFFNLLPIPPLDGSAVVERMLPKQWWPIWLKFRQYSFGILLFVILFLPQFGEVHLHPRPRVWGVMVG